MSKLDDIINHATHEAIIGEQDIDWICTEASNQVKDLMRKTYNGALQLWIDKEAANVDEAFEKKVADL